MHTIETYWLSEQNRKKGHDLTSGAPDPEYCIRAYVYVHLRIYSRHNAICIHIYTRGPAGRREIYYK